MKILYKTILITACVFWVTNSQAHKRWVLPSLFNVSEPQWITVDATVSNNLFFSDRPWPLSGVTVITPDGKEVLIENKIEGHRRSSFDVQLTEKGTYKVVSSGAVYFAQYDVKGTDKPQRERAFDFDKLKKKIPTGVSNLQFAKSISRLESYVTLGAPDETVFTPLNSGIELMPLTHPNDLYKSEKARFKFLVNGALTAGLEAHVVWEGTRHRNSENSTTYQSDDQGILTIDLNQSGRFLIEIDHEVDAKDDPDFTKYYFGYFGTFEVLPQ